MSRTPLIAVAVAFALGSSLAAQAQSTEPAAPPTDQYGGAYSAQYGGAYSVGAPSPYAQILQVPPAAAAAAYARAQYSRVRTDMNLLLLTMQADQAADPQWQQANRELDQARQQYAAARQRIVDQVQQNADYRAAASARDTYGELISAMHRQSANDPAVLDLSARKMEASASASRILGDALAADADVQRAKTALLAAGQRVAELRMKFDSSVRHDPNWRAAREQFADARVRMLTTDTYLCATLASANVALNFAGFVVDQTRFRPIIYGDYGGYGSAYGYGPSYGPTFYPPVGGYPIVWSQMPMMNAR